jgi:hypothetical protein
VVSCTDLPLTAACCLACCCPLQACLLVLPLLTELSQQQQLAHLAHLPALSHLLSALQATLNDAADPSADMVVSYRELPWRHGQLLLHVASDELPVLRWGSWGWLLSVCARQSRVTRVLCWGSHAGCLCWLW